MGTQIIRTQDIIKMILKKLNISFNNHWILLLRLNHKNKTARCIIDKNTQKTKKLNYLTKNTTKTT